MTIHLPEHLERSILAEVQSGHFESADAAVAEIVRAYFRQRGQQPASPVEGTFQPDPVLGSIGAMREAADELDEIVEDAMRRRERLDDLMEYKRKDDETRRRIADELTADAQELGLGY